MTTSFNTIQDLMSSCGNSRLKSMVSFVLKSNKYISWNLISCSVDNEGKCLAEFESQIHNSDQRYHLSSKVTTHGEYHYCSVI